MTNRTARRPTAECASFQIGDRKPRMRPLRVTVERRINAGGRHLVIACGPVTLVLRPGQAYRLIDRIADELDKPWPPKAP